MYRYSNVRIQLPLELKQKISFPHFRENIFAKIDENGENVDDTDYLGNGA
jgi:hypothetical protein